MVRCEPATYTDTKSQPPALLHGFHVVLRDTVLFPEGGGQPSDRGTLNGLPVLHVHRDYADAVHFVHTAEPLAVGASVQLEVDWPLRHDQMQQHSGQHLITAVLEQDCGWDTTAWYMGADTSYVHLNVASCDAERLRAAERKINAIIADGCPVSVETIADVSAVGADGEQVTRATRGLPRDHVGAVRIVTFAGIESNMCCGTHVRNLSQLQMVRLLHTEPVKGGAATLLHFVVGGRVHRYAVAAWTRERRLNVLLGGEPAVHADLVQKAQEKLRQAQRTVKRLQKELAVAEASQVDAGTARWHFVHRRDGVADGAAYVQAVLAAVRRKGVLVVGTAGEEANWAQAGGKLMVQGEATDVERLGPVLCEMLGGKGAGKNGRYQAKVSGFGRLGECEAKVVEYFERLQVGK